MEHIGEVIGQVTVVSPPVKFSESPLEARPTVPLGKHSREILLEGGLGTAQIDVLFERGVVKEVNETLADLL